jgi:hypothetical protein
VRTPGPAKAALCCILASVVLIGCEDDDSVELPERNDADCLESIRGDVRGDHVHGGARICGVDRLLGPGDVQLIEVTRGETFHTHVFFVSVRSATSALDGETVYFTTIEDLTGHVHEVAYNAPPEGTR